MDAAKAARMTPQPPTPRHCVSVSLSAAEHEKLRQLGGSVWVQRLIAATPLNVPGATRHYCSAAKAGGPG